MKNAQLIFAIILMNSFFSILSAQNKNWEIGASYSATSLKINAKKNKMSDGESSSSPMVTLNVLSSRNISSHASIGFGIGQSWLDYQLKINKTTHQLDSKINFSDQPDRTKRPKKLDHIDFNNNYLNIPVFAKVKLLKNSDKAFQPALGLRLDNYFLQNSSSSYDYDGGGSEIIGGLFLTFLTGNIDYLSVGSGQQWDLLTSGQRQEIADYYDQQNSKYALLITPSISFDWRFKKVGFGFEPHFVLASKKVNTNLESQPGIGVRTYFFVRF